MPVISSPNGGFFGPGSLSGVPYLDFAASAPMRPEALNALLVWASGANPTGVHGPARAAKAALEAAREQIATACGATPSEVVFTGGGTEADNLAILGAAHPARAAGRGDGVVVSAIEHKAVLAAVDRLEAEGFRVTRVAPDAFGRIDADAFLAACDAQTVLASLMLVNNETGVRQPVAEVAARLRTVAPHAVMHTDAVQGAVWCDLAAETADVDLVALSAHKVGGPKGIGALIVRNGVPLEPQSVGGGQERELRGGTQNVAGAAAFGVALAETLAEQATTNARVQVLSDRLRVGLLALPGAFLNGDPALLVPGITSIGFAGVNNELLVISADRAELACSAGASCASGAAEPSHVHLAAGRTPEEARQVIRLSIGYSTTDADIDAALDVITACVERIRGAAVPR